MTLFYVKTTGSAVGFDGNVFQCPTCGGNNLHLRCVAVEVNTLETRNPGLELDADSAVLYVGAPEGTLSEGPNDLGTVLHFNCEACHAPHSSMLFYPHQLHINCHEGCATAVWVPATEVNLKGAP